MKPTKLKVGKVKPFKQNSQANVIGIVAISALAIVALVVTCK